MTTPGPSARRPHRRETHAIASRALGRTLPVTVLLPAGYDDAPDAHFPVLYLLHGGLSHHAEWSEQIPLAQMLAGLPLIVVTPEGESSLYIDGANGEPFAHYTLWDVPAWTEATFRVDARREKRALAGLSMGGFGAFNLGLTHPERYAALGSLSGAFGMTWWGFGKQQPFLSALGPDGHLVRERVNPWRVLERAVAERPPNVPWPKLHIAVGTEDDPEVLDAHRAFHHSLTRFGLPHAYLESPGEHHWKYWNLSTPPLLTFIAQALELEPT